MLCAKETTESRVNIPNAKTHYTKIVPGDKSKLLLTTFWSPAAAAGAASDVRLVIPS